MVINVCRSLFLTIVGSASCVVEALETHRFNPIPRQVVKILRDKNTVKSFILIRAFHHLLGS